MLLLSICMICAFVINSVLTDMDGGDDDGPGGGLMQPI
jgi:hypothetical protein